MKALKKYLTIGIPVLIAVLLSSSCKKVLDQEPQSNITPENYLNEESQLAAYAIARYNILPSNNSTGFGIFGIDNDTDNMAGVNMNTRYAPGQWLVGSSGGEWSFNNIFQMNYFLQDVIPKWKANKIVGGPEEIKHYIGEMYFLRAFEYFNKLQSLGDFPILRTVLKEDKDLLIAASQRMPRTEVARFILSDLDSAILLMKPIAPGGAKNRLSKNCALLFKSRVALFEATWLKYFKGTAFVPNGSNWPGKSKSYNANYQFKSGSIESEIDHFFTESMSAAKIVSDAVPLVNNTGIIESLNNENPYFSMFSAENMSGYTEVLLWRQYNRTLVTHNVPVYAMLGNGAAGTTRSMVESFLMADGLPIYASPNYKGDNYIADVRANRDGRLNLFLKEPGQKNVLVNQSGGTHVTPVEPIPLIWVSTTEQKYTTGYAIRKGLNYDGNYASNTVGYTGSITFRSSEAMLNYIEASYEKTGTIDATARSYWRQLRERAKVSTNIDQTISATVMNNEKLDWGSYSANTLIDPTLYNIRRERRSELMAEGLRWMDLRRWRSLDQMITTPGHIEGFKLWGPMKDWFKPEQRVFGASSTAAVVSDPALGPYLRPFEIRSNTISYQGVRWNLAHYLSPISIQHFINTATGADLSASPIYQNPGWPLQANVGPM